MHSRFDSYKNEIDTALATLLKDRCPRELYDPMAYVLEAGGKRIRPLLVLLACQASGGSEDSAWPAALAVEILHTFTLVHDDIMDGDDLRRGRPTLHKAWDEATAILAGDGLVTLAYQTLLSASHPSIAEAARIFTEGLLVLCEGQALDKAFESREGVALSEYTTMIQKKTGKLLEVACEVGAVLGDATTEIRRHLVAFAGAWGEAFQIQDDWLDIMADARVLGKPSCSDVRARKQTFLTLHFFENADASARLRFMPFWGAEQMSDADIETVRSLMADSGSLEAAKKAVSRLTDTAESHLKALPDTDACRQFIQLVDRLRDRSY